MLEESAQHAITLLLQGSKTLHEALAVSQQARILGYELLCLGRCSLPGLHCGPDADGSCSHCCSSALSHELPLQGLDDGSLFVQGMLSGTQAAPAQRQLTASAVLCCCCLLQLVLKALDLHLQGFTVPRNMFF